MSKTVEQMMSDLIAVISERMHTLGLTAEELADRADIEETTMLNLLALREPLEVEQLVRIGNALGERAGDLAKAGEER